MVVMAVSHVGHMLLSRPVLLIALLYGKVSNTVNVCIDTSHSRKTDADTDSNGSKWIAHE